MKKYEVKVYVSECETDTFSIIAEDIATAQKIAAEETFQRGYPVDDLIDVKEIEEIEEIEEDDYVSIPVAKIGEKGENQ